jgi:hypothetical protein
MARCAVPVRVQRAERMLKDVRGTLYVAPLNAARTAQRAVPTPVAVFRCAPQFFARRIMLSDARKLAKVLGL